MQDYKFFVGIVLGIIILGLSFLVVDTHLPGPIPAVQLLKALTISLVPALVYLIYIHIRYSGNLT